jgi:hypothetical protein
VTARHLIAGAVVVVLLLALIAACDDDTDSGGVCGDWFALAAAKPRATPAPARTGSSPRKQPAPGRSKPRGHGADIDLCG